MAETKKPNVLIIGGCGFIGRNLVHYLVSTDACNHIKVIDKAIPSVSHFSKEHSESFSHPSVKFKQGNAKSEESLRRCWKSKHGPFEYVFNLAAETKYGQDPVVYEEITLEVVRTIIKVGRDKSVKRFFDISTGQVYSSDKKAAKETSSLKPWTTLAEYKLKAEQLWKESDLPVIILRTSTVYGPGDVSGIMPRITIARCYQHMRKTMKLLWGSDLRINTVHVDDVCAALWHLTTHGDNGSIFNLSDKSDTDQKKMNQLLEKIFLIKTGYVGKLANNVARLSLNYITKSVNTKHMNPWLGLTHQSGVVASPISPYLSSELLSNNHLSLDGSLIESTGFTYKHPQITEELVSGEIDYWLSINAFPKLDRSRVEIESEDSSDFEIDEE